MLWLQRPTHHGWRANSQRIGPSDKWPVLAHRGRTTCEKGALFSTENIYRVSGHSDPCSSRIELEIILTLRKNVLPLLLVEGRGNPSPRGIAEVCKPDQANGLCTRLQSSSSQRWRCGTTARSRRTIASIIWDWTADQDSRSNSWRPGQAIVQAMA
jgi:hypothetical protein